MKDMNMYSGDNPIHLRLTNQIDTRDHCPCDMHMDKFDHYSADRTWGAANASITLLVGEKLCRVI